MRGSKTGSFVRGKNEKFLTQVDEKITILFREELDLSQIHSKVLSSFKDNSDEISMLKFLLVRQERSLLEKFGFVEASICAEEIRTLKANIYRLEHFTEKENYIRESDKIFEVLKLIPTSKHQKKDTTYVPCQDDLDRIYCLSEYLKLAQKYINLTFSTIGLDPVLPWNVCVSCHQDLSNCILSKDDIISCPRCSFERTIRSPKEDFGKNKKKKGQTEKEVTQSITKSLHEYQGHISLKLNIEKLIKDVEFYFKTKTKVPCREQILKSPHLKNGKKRGTSVPIMRNALKMCGYKCYGATRHICKIVWDWKLEDLTYIEGKIINDAIDIDEGYNKIPAEEKGRMASISGPVMLYFLLRNRDVSVDIEDFKIPKDVENCNRLLRLACRYCTNKEIVFKRI